MREALKEIGDLLERAEDRKDRAVGDVLFVLTGLRNMLIRIEYLEEREDRSV